MIPVSQQFLDEQMKTHSGAMRLEIVASKGAEQKTLTPYLLSESLSRLEQDIEETLTTFGFSDIQFTMWYDKEIWTWLKDNTGIELEVKSGFHFEKIIKFTGYVDRDNVRLDTNGTIYIRAYGQSTRAKTITAVKPYWLTFITAKDCVNRLFGQLGIGEDNMTIKIKPIDLDENAWSEIYQDAGTQVLPFDRLPGLTLTDHKFIFGVYFGIDMLTYDEDYADYVVTHAFTSGGKLINIIPWGENHFAAILGNSQQFKYQTAGGGTDYEDWVATNIEIYDFELNLIDSIALTPQTVGDWIYYPMGKTIYHLRNLNKFVVGWNGADQTPMYHPIVNMVRWQTRDADSGDLVKAWTSEGHFIHPETQATSGIWQSFYFSLMCPINGTWLEDNKYVRIILGEYLQSGNIGYNGVQLNGNWIGFDFYVLNYGGRIFDLTTLTFVTDFWSPDYWVPIRVESIFRDGKQILTGYGVSNDVLQVKIWEDYTTTSYIYGPPVVPEGYTAHLKGFMYWHTNNGIDNFIIFMQSEDEDSNIIHNICTYSNRWFPFVDADYNDMNVRQVLDELAKSFCCVYHFPDNSTGVFISRDFLPSTKYPVHPSLRLKRWYVTPFATRRVNVNGVEYGVGEKLLTISSDFVPDNDMIAEGVAKKYYDFVSAWNSTIEFSGDMLIQYEPLDMLTNIINPVSGGVYEGRIVKQVQEGDKVNFTLRGIYLTTQEGHD